jgi:ferredoxin-NADP reductase
MRLIDRVITGYERLTRFDRAPRPAPPVLRELDVLVEQVHTPADEVRALHLVRPDGRALPAWQPGAHLDVVLPSGRVRQYSLCGDPADRHRYRIAVRRIADGGGGSREVHQLRVGDRLRVRWPRHAFPFVRADRYLFLAGGIGITPILPMVRAAHAAGADWQLVHCGRTRESLPFLDELAALPADRVWIRADTEWGVPASGAELLARAAPGAAVYCCGPIPMITGVRADLAASPAGSLHFERFSPPPVVGGRPFRLELARSGQVLDVPADRSALDVLLAARPDTAYSCRQGFCGTCKVRRLGGAPDHRDHALSSAERADHLVICVSRADGDHLVLDL